jgi:hypothetical protein
MFYRAPYYFRLDLKKLGDRQALIGSNESHYWVYTREDDAFACGAAGGVNEDWPLRSDQLIEALGLTPIPAGGAGAEMTVQADHQRVAFDGKEYWLDRRAPRLVRKVIFRGSDGAVAMSSDLGDYQAAQGGAYLPHRINAEWPRRNARLWFDVSRWNRVDDVLPGGPQFATPDECLRRPDGHARR